MRSCALTLCCLLCAHTLTRLCISTKLGEGVKYHNTGVLRNKPGRGHPSQSHSCSDKIARWNVIGTILFILCLCVYVCRVHCCISCSLLFVASICAGIQGALLASILSSPLYFSSVTVGELYNAAALKRALCDRFAAVDGTCVYVVSVCVCMCAGSLSLVLTVDWCIDAITGMYGRVQPAILECSQRTGWERSAVRVQPASFGMCVCVCVVCSLLMDG